jgi:hypothetical protein
VERLEANIVVILLKEDRIVVLKADVQTKKLMGALIKVVRDEHYTLTEDKDLAIGLVSMKWCVVFFMFHRFSFMICHCDFLIDLIVVIEQDQAS